MKPTILALLALAFAVCSAFALDPHVEAVIRTVEAAKGKVEKTGDGQSLKLVDVAVPGAGPHDHRKDDPYDLASFEHLGHITTEGSVNVISTKFNDEWMPHIAKLNRLKTLRLTNNGKLVERMLPKAMEPLREFDSASISSRLNGNRHHVAIIAENLDSHTVHTLEIELLFTPNVEQELRIESICLAGGEAKVFPIQSK